MPSKKGSKQWLHPPEALTRGHILYTVKFLGECTVDQPKGTEVVKDAIRKMKFSKHIKRAEGIKSAKVNLTVSAEAVKIMEPKTRTCLHQYPLHRISYCADDKSDKRMFTFIAKDANSNDHYCYVFDSEKCAEEITLTIGQAFDLAYKQFLETSNSDGDLRRQCVLLQKKVQVLMFEKEALMKRLVEMEKLKDRADIEEYKKNNQIDDISSLSLTFKEGHSDEVNEVDDEEEPIYSLPNEPKVGSTSTVGRRLENLILSEDLTQPASQTNGSRTGGDSPSTPTGLPILSPPPVNTRQSRHTPQARTGSSNNFFPPTTPSSPSRPTNPFISNTSSNPFSSPTNGGPFTSSSNGDPFSVDPFGMEAFSPGVKANGSRPTELQDMQAGFSQGLSFGADDFNLTDLDPLSQRS